jgi:hypothetical protein
MASKPLKKRKRQMTRSVRRAKNQVLRNNKVYEKHHIIPKSRGGPVTNSNIILVQRRYHQSWHHLFGNLTPAEAILHILRFWNIGSVIDELTIETIVRMCGGKTHGAEKSSE